MSVAWQLTHFQGTTLVIGDTGGVASFYARIPGSADASQIVGAWF
jgi:hypothetical protein